MGAFPSNIIDTITPFLADIPEVTSVVGRPVRIMDPHGTAGIFAGDWNPREYEIGNEEPSFGRYNLAIQFNTKGTPETVYRAKHADGSKNIRSMLYRDQDLRVALAALSETTMGVTERYGRFEVVRQRFFSNDMKGSFVFLSHIDLWVETRT